MAYIMTTEAEIIQKAGAGKSATFDTAMMTAANLQAESTVNCFGRYNFSDLVTAGLNADIKGLLSDICSSLVAIEAIAYDTSGYDSIREAEDKISVLRDSALRGLSLISDETFREFIKENAT